MVSPGRYVGATGPWREDLERVDAGAVVAALVAERDVVDERLAALEAALQLELTLLAKQGSGAL